MYQTKTKAYICCPAHFEVETMAESWLTGTERAVSQEFNQMGGSEIPKECKCRDTGSDKSLCSRSRESSVRAGGGGLESRVGKLWAQTHMALSFP